MRCGGCGGGCGRYGGNGAWRRRAGRAGVGIVVSSSIARKKMRLFWARYIKNSRYIKVCDTASYTVYIKKTALYITIHHYTSLYSRPHVWSERIIDTSATIHYTSATIHNDTSRLMYHHPSGKHSRDPCPLSVVVVLYVSRGIIDVMAGHRVTGRRSITV